MNPEIDRFFEQRPLAKALFEAVDFIMQEVAPSTPHVTRSQIVFRRRTAFAWVWTPDRWLKGQTAPLVLSLALRRRDASARWKEVVEPSPGHWMHHLELREPAEIDDRVRAWLREAWESAD